MTFAHPASRFWVVFGSYCSQIVPKFFRSLLGPGEKRESFCRPDSVMPFDAVRHIVIMSAHIRPIEFWVNLLGRGQLFAVSDTVQRLLQSSHICFGQRSKVPDTETQGTGLLVTLQHGMQTVTRAVL